jgi:glycosyltransferase involved in cell wall biosynthesis
VTTAELPSWDLVVASVDRVDQLGRLLASLEEQTHGGFRILLVDQNDDGRLDGLLDKHARLDIEHLSSARGLARARNVALPRVDADLVAFPDDDCVYPADLLERVARRFAAEPGLDGVTGRAVDAAGRSSRSWSAAAARLTRDNLWNRAISFTIFLRSELVRSVGAFDEELGLGSGTAWSSGEETEYLVRAVAQGARIDYDPTVTVIHDAKPLSDSLGAREGASIGYILRKHRYPKRVVTRMLIRPAGGALLALAARDPARARFQLDTLRGRLRGYRS